MSLKVGKSYLSLGADMSIAGPAPCGFPEAATSDNGPPMSELAVKAMPRRGRLWVIAILALGLFALGYSIVQISTQKAGRAVVHIAGITEAQEIFGGVPQEGDRLGSSDAPVTIQIFNDLQCSSC